MVSRCACALAIIASGAACGGKASDDDSGGSGRGSGSATPVDGAAAGATVDAVAITAPADGAPPAPGGDLDVKVQWRDVPTAARSSPGRTPCNTPRAPSVAPTTMWQVPDAFVFVEGAGTLPPEARVRLADCAFAPRVAVGAALVLESASDRPVVATIAKWGDAADPSKVAAGASPPGRTIQLPIAGHAVAVALEPGGVYRLAADGADAEVAWVVAAPAAVTEASGQVQVRAPIGSREIRAFVPARGGQPARLGSAKATVTADLVEVTVTVAP